jgi:F-type H+-transporting ATPase subunit alpha
MVELLKQKQHHTYPMHEQVLLLFAAVNGYLEEVNVSDVKLFEVEFLAHMRQKHMDLIEKIKTSMALTEESTKELKEILSSFIETRFKG